MEINNLKCEWNKKTKFWEVWTPEDPPKCIGEYAYLSTAREAMKNNRKFKKKKSKLMRLEDL